MIKDLAIKIKMLRKDKNLSQADIANYLNIARPIISNWEQGKSEPSLSQLKQLGIKFEVSTDFLLGLVFNKNYVIIDSCIFINRPNILEIISKLEDFEVLIPQVIIEELDNLKNSNKKFIKQNASLAIKNINENKNRIKIELISHRKEKNDLTILDYALKTAEYKSKEKVYLLTLDNTFFIRKVPYSNLEIIDLATFQDQFLLQQTNFSSSKTRDFFYHVKNNNEKEVKLFDLTEVDINAIDVSTGKTPLTQAITNKNEKIIEYLLEQKDIDLNKIDDSKYKFAPIHYAAQFNKIKFIKLFCENGADIDIVSQGKNIGNTAIKIAAWHGYTEIVEFLLQQGSCVNHQDNNGYTPLIKACIRNHIECIKLLLPVSDVKIRSKENKTAFDYLKKYKTSDLELIEYIEKYNRIKK